MERLVVSNPAGGRPLEARGTARGASGAARALVLSLLVTAFAAGSPAATAQTPYHPPTALLEAIDWYTGVTGRVDDDRARTLLLEAAATGDPLAAMWIARVHYRGRMGFPQDSARAHDQAVRALPEVRRLAEAGEVEAVFLMGTAYDEGLGVVVDPVRAAAWHRRAAEAGHVLGQHNLGNQYASGRGVTQDSAAAVMWWTPAGRAGDAIVQLRLGEAFESGVGVERSLDTALRWYRDAAERGNQGAREALDRLGG